MEPTIILVAGYAASGKSRVSQELARRLGTCCYLDKDTLFEPMVDRLLVALGQQYGDRDSTVYRDEVLPLEYSCMMATAFEAATFGVSVILSAPFLHQLANNDWMKWFAHEIASRGAKSRIVWVSCSRGVLRRRMIDRGSPRDRAKLEDWSSYAAAVDEDFLRRIQEEVLVFENSDPLCFEEQLNQVFRSITGA